MILVNILKGIAAYQGSFQLIRKLKLWKYFAIPIAISLITATTIGLLAWNLGDDLGVFIQKIWIWEWGAQGFQKVSNVMGVLIILVLGLILYRHIIMALSAPFMGVVSEKIEKHHYGEHHFHEESGFFQLLLRGIRINVRNLLLEILITIPIFILGFIPVIGIVSSVLVILVQSYYAGFGNMDYTLERHYTYSNSIKFVRNNRGIAIGNGLIFIVILMIPVIGIILVLPFSVTAASVATLKRMESDETVNLLPKKVA